MTLDWREDEDRWFLGGHPVMAGTAMEIAAEFNEGKPLAWTRVRIESQDAGRTLVAHLIHRSMEWTRTIAHAAHQPAEGPQKSPWSSVSAKWPAEVEDHRDRFLRNVTGGTDG